MYAFFGLLPHVLLHTVFTVDIVLFFFLFFFGLGCLTAFYVSVFRQWLLEHRPTGADEEAGIAEEDASTFAETDP